MPKETRSNHFSPKFSNQFWAGKAGAITRLFRGERGEIWNGRTSAKMWGCKEGLYTQAVEDGYEKVETRIAPLYKKLMAHVALSPIERLHWSQWILCQFARTPTIMLELAEMPGDIFKALNFECDLPRDTVGKNLKGQESLGLEFPCSQELIGFIALRDWVILRPSEGEFFIKGDVPVMIRGAFIEDDARIVYPLSPDRCFVATVLGTFPPHQLQADVQLKPGGTKQFHQMIASVSEREVICRPDHFSPELVAVVQENLSKSVRYIHHGLLPHDW